jgi:hypothetical protein
MLNCPECHKEMMWIGDSDTVDEDVYVTLMVCNDCSIDVSKYWGDGIDGQ